MRLEYAGNLGTVRSYGQYGGGVCVCVVKINHSTDTTPLSKGPRRRTRYAPAAFGYFAWKSGCHTLFVGVRVFYKTQR